MFFSISKVGWALVSPDSILVLLLLVCCFLLWRRSYKKAKKLLLFVTVVFLLISLFPIGSWLRYPLETRFTANPELPAKVDGIILLSGPERADLSDVWKQMQLEDGAERHLAFMELARRYPQANLVFSGGSRKLFEQRYKAADYALELFKKQGINTSRIIFERESRNTYENAFLSFNLVQPVAGETWVLVTSASHMPRSVGIFCKINWPVIAYPVDHRTMPNLVFKVDWKFSRHLSDLYWVSREWVGLFVYYITGKTDDLLPDGC